MANPNDLIHSFNSTEYSEGHFTGLTKREYFAAMALNSACDFGFKSSINDEQIARKAVDIADALINALNEKK